MLFIEDGASVIVGAETPGPLLKHSLASPSTVAYVMCQKYVNSVPLYRQEADWKQLGVKLSRATLANWVIKCGIDYMEPVYGHLHQCLLERDIIHADETPCQVLKRTEKQRSPGPICGCMDPGTMSCRRSACMITSPAVEDIMRRNS